MYEEITTPYLTSGEKSFIPSIIEGLSNKLSLDTYDSYVLDSSNYCAEYLFEISFLTEQVYEEPMFLVFPEFDRASEIFQNKILKVLEEGAPNIVFLLIDSQVEGSIGILPTIRSRCIYFRNPQSLKVEFDKDALHLFKISFRDDFIYNSLKPFPSGRTLQDIVRGEDFHKFLDNVTAFFVDRLCYLMEYRAHHFEGVPEALDAIRSSEVKGSQACKFLNKSLGYSKRFSKTLDYMWLKGICSV